LKKIYLIILLSIGLSSCKSFKKTSYSETHKIKLTKLLKQIQKHRFDAKSFESRVAITYQDQHQDISGYGKIRILKDSIIWGSINFLGIPMVKFYITPQKIQYYNKIEKTYYDGSFDFLQKQLGVPVSFDNLQNLLLGDLITPVNKEDSQLSITKSRYTVATGNRYLKKLEITPFYKVLSETLFDPYQGDLTVKYQEYQQHEKENLPAYIHIQTPDKKLQLHYKNISLNKDLRFPFSIPNNYSKIQF